MYKQMINPKRRYDEIFVHGYKLHIYKTKIRIFKNEDTIDEDFRDVCDQIIQYLMDEMFIPQKNKIKVEIISP